MKHKSNLDSYHIDAYPTEGKLRLDRDLHRSVTRHVSHCHLCKLVVY